MNTKLKLIFTIFVTFQILVTGNTNLQAANELIQKAKEVSKEAFIKYEVNLYKESIGICERVLSAEPENSKAKYYLAYNQYRLLIMPGKSESDNLFDTYFDQAVENAKSISDMKGFQAEARALLAAIYMMKLSKNQTEAPSISAKIYGLLREAQAIDSLNPRMYLVKGIMLFHTPEMFGGSVHKALDNFNKAISKFKTEKANFIDWGYLETLAWKGQAFTKLNKYEEAEKTYKKALTKEPEFAWIKQALLPGLLNQKSNTNSQNVEDTTSTANIKVFIKNLENNKGKLRIALSNSKESYELNKPFRAIAVLIKNKIVEYTFDNIPFGEYAIKFFHDENENEELDKNLFGMPTEEYGFSNNATGSFGPASFDDAKFIVNKKVITQEITVQ